MKTTNLTKTMLAAASLCAGLVLPYGAAAQSYPSEPIRVINPWSPGGPAETMARPIMERLSQELGQPIVIESKSGAGGTVGSDYVAKAKPDGYTLLFSHVGPTAIVPATRKAMPYDSQKDFAHVSTVASTVIALAVRPELPIKTVADLVDYAKKNPGKLAYGSVGPGSTTHLAGELLRIKTGIDILHVPYRGAAPVIKDILGGQIQITFLAYSALDAHARAGNLRLIAVTGLNRAKVAPDLPTVAETIPGFEINSWYGLSAPGGTPEAIVDKLNAALGKAIADDKIQQHLTKLGIEPIVISPAEFRTKIASDLKLWADLVAAAGITKK